MVGVGIGRVVMVLPLARGLVDRGACMAMGRFAGRLVWACDRMVVGHGLALGWLVVVVWFVAVAVA